MQIRNTMSRLPLLLFLSCVEFARCDFTFIGKCPVVKPMENFDIFDFLGLWYTIEKSPTTIPCRQYGFLEKLEKRGEFRYYDIDPDSKARQKYEMSDLIVPEWNAASMIVNHGRQKSNFVVLSTDCGRYASTVMYRQVGAACKLSAKLLSRNPELDEDVIKDARLSLESYNLTTPVHCYEPPTTTISTTTTESTETVTLPRKPSFHYLRF
ncbi:hypothetical protein RI129_012264 [Pyrocoelia pectoralis]|uniref:Apolipoprotein D n=1 Tax=Pyrocoelia pectoralis TaxID=417401 RepID=A0AAN7V6Z5_9COLE